MTQHDGVVSHHRRITGETHLIDALTVLIGILLAATVVVATSYYRVLRRAQREYEKAREVVEDVVLSFNRQLQREAEKLESVAFRAEAASSKADGTSKNISEVRKVVQALELELHSVTQGKEEVLAKIEEFHKEMQEVATAQSAFTTQISSLSEQVKQFPTIPEPNVQAVIPIKRDRALAPLTETELSVLEMLASEGSKTAPEIKDRVKLSREHTARLMKKLYEGGYLERDRTKIPFKYSVKKEMGALLKKTEGEAT